MKMIKMVIPTRNRQAKLDQMLDSVPTLNYLRTVVVCDGDVNTYESLTRHPRENVNARLVRVNKGSVFCRNMETATADDGVLCIMDDVQLLPGAIQSAFANFNRKFPDDDGVIGFNFVNGRKPSKTGVCLVGQTFLHRYIDRKLYCPEYFHFAAQEISKLCDKLGGKYFKDMDAKLLHFHPILNKTWMDQTHLDGRRRHKEDRETSKRRRQDGLIWGWPDEK